MASLILERDKQYGITMAWHKKTIIPSDGILRKEVIFPRIQTVELVRADGGKLEYPIAIGVSEDDNISVGTAFAPGSYTFRSPHEDIDLVTNALSGTGYKIASAGTVQNRSKYFFSVSLDELKSMEIGGRRFDQYLNVIGSFDGSLPAFFNQSSICTVCNNTLQMNLLAKVEFQQKIRHTKNMRENMIDVEKLLEETFGVSKLFQSALESLASVKCEPEKAGRIYAGYLTPEKDEAMSSRTANTVARLVEMQSGEKAPNGGQYGLGNRGETMLDTLSAFTQFRTRGFDTYGDSVKRPMAQFASSEFGLGAREKVEFGLLLGDKKRLQTVEKRGKEILSRPIRTRDAALVGN